LHRLFHHKTRAPDVAARPPGSVFVWGEAHDGGTSAWIRIRTAEAYALTVSGALGVVERLLENPAPPGSTTPARLMGSRYVLSLPGTTLLARG
jgi:short subunit dehydrogenase-like uncharacterized protein